MYVSSWVPFPCKLVFKGELYQRVCVSLVLEPTTACLLPSAGDHSNIIFGVLRSNHKEQGKFKDNVIKKTIWVKKKSTFAL